MFNFVPDVHLATTLLIAISRSRRAIKFKICWRCLAVIGAYPWSREETVEAHSPHNLPISRSEILQSRFAFNNSKSGSLNTDRSTMIITSQGPIYRTAVNNFEEKRRFSEGKLKKKNANQLMSG
jgi:hypothetical protein